MLRNELHQRQYKAKALHVETDGICVSLSGNKPREKREAAGRCARSAVITF
jgi:hypothetical protein